LPGANGSVAGDFDGEQLARLPPDDVDLTAGRAPSRLLLDVAARPMNRSRAVSTTMPVSE